MRKSNYENRARAIHGDKFVDYSALIPKTPMEEYWNKNVKCREDVEQFYRLYFPYLPDVLIKALALHLEAQVQGKIPPSEYFYRNSEQNRNHESQVWDYKRELEEYMMDAKIKLAAYRLEDLLADEEDEPTEKSKKCKKK